MTPVRPEEVDPENSLKAPRGKPPVSVSRAAIPVDTVSGAARSRSSKVDEIWLPSDDSIRVRKLETELPAKAALTMGVTTTDDIRTFGRAEYREQFRFLFAC